MYLKITSDSIGNPLLVRLLRKLTESFCKVDKEFYVIGATARDIIMQQMHGIESARRTKDLDIAIAIQDWSAFEQIKKCLVDDGFTTSRRMHQRFFYGDYEIDIVPYGPVAKEDDNIYWPPDEDIVMSVKGFDEVLSEPVLVSIDDEFHVRVVSLHGLFLLKFNAWLDRSVVTNKDAEDMAFIMSNYFMANLSRGVHPEVYDWEPFDDYVAGAYWLAHDLAAVLDSRQLRFYKEKIEVELAEKEDSKLINQMLESTYGLTYETVRRAWQAMATVFGI